MDNGDGESGEENSRVTWGLLIYPYPYLSSIYTHLSIIYLSVFHPSVHQSVIFLSSIRHHLSILYSKEVKHKILPAQSPQFLAIRDFPLPCTDHPTVF